MKIRKLVSLSVQSILKNRMRSILTSLGIIIGVSAVIIMVALGEGTRSDIEAQINSLGADMVIIFPARHSSRGVSMGSSGRPSLTLDDWEFLASRSSKARAISPISGSNSQVISSYGNWNSEITGVSTQYLTVRDWDISEGEFFSDRDVRSRAKVAVVGQTIVDNLFPSGNAVGERIRIRNIPFQIIGVLKSRGQNAMGKDEDDVILAPVTTVCYRLRGNERLNTILASGYSTETLAETEEELQQLLRENHKIEENEEDDFTIRNQAEIVETASEATKVMTMLLGAIAGVSLLVGGIGIMNIMLVSVTERTREIGIRLAVGARGSDVMFQFLTEAVALCLSGGIIGTGFSFAVVYGFNYFGISAIIQPVIVGVSLIFSAVVGIFFGFYPARRAAALDPIEALRHE